MALRLFDVVEEKLKYPDLLIGLGTFEFAVLVVDTYLGQLAKAGQFITGDTRQSIEEELRDEVITMTRKKTYGYYSLEEYGRSQVNRGCKRP